MQAFAHSPNATAPAHRTQGFGQIGRTGFPDPHAPGRVIELPRRRAGEAPRPSSLELAAAARRHRTLQWQRLVSTALHSLVAWAARSRAAWRNARLEPSLHDLDDRALRDLGLTRSELPSLGAELRGAAQPTRVWALQARRDLFC